MRRLVRSICDKGIRTFLEVEKNDKMYDRLSAEEQAAWDATMLVRRKTWLLNPHPVGTPFYFAW